MGQLWWLPQGLFDACDRRDCCFPILNRIIESTEVLSTRVDLFSKPQPGQDWALFQIRRPLRPLTGTRSVCEFCRTGDEDQCMAHTSVRDRWCLQFSSRTVFPPLIHKRSAASFPRQNVNPKLLLQSDLGKTRLSCNTFSELWSGVVWWWQSL